MKKIAIFLVASTALTSTFAAPQSTTSALYPMDSFNPNKFNSSSLSEFAKRYAAEVSSVLKKGEFETTVAYEARVAQGTKFKSLDSDKIYAFKLDSISVNYNPDTALYEVDSGGKGPKGRLLDRSIFGVNSSSTLRVGELSRTSSQYKASNAYGKTANVIQIKGKDFYIESSKSFKNVNNGGLTFPADIETAKKNATCNKQVYVFAKLTGKPIKSSNFDYAMVSTPKINLPLDIQILKQTVGMDIVGMVLRCSTGTILSIYEQTLDDGNEVVDIETEEDAIRRLAIKGRDIF
ncbi:hypothetical protein B9T24_16595 [Acinetobacter sp. ANC 4654]|uniref:hypothetical protein n=1 Tax=Acinetobacter sp. ANC 4654 TaxID=1977872 RepID=UPI000A359A9F|nr:hypothetical protein [Acinetobacter sp. ANC 4654]OTG89837.1 hypothetical protein B9T24_16595 [Acinetobacter sp. ANC 4654]